MRSLYAAEFEIAPYQQEDAIRLPTDVQNIVHRWIRDWYRTRMSIDIVFNSDNNDFAPTARHHVKTSANIAKAYPASQRTITWTYPDISDGNLLWHSSTEISEYKGAVEISFLLRIESTQFYISPFSFSLRRPSLIPLLLQNFLCHYGGTRLFLEVQNLPVAAIQNFVERLESSQRRLPIILISKNQMGETLVEPSEIASALCGISEVYLLEDKWASYELTDHIGKTYSCFNGAVRIYWPNFSASKNSFTPIYLPEQVRELHTAGLRDTLFRQLAAISAFRWVRGPVAIDAQEFLDDQMAKETAELRAAAIERGDYKELASLYETENSDLLKQTQELKQQLQDTKARLEISEENFKAVWDTVAKPETMNQVVIEPEDVTSPETVLDAVQDAQRKFGGTLLFLEDALASAKETPFKQPDKVGRALLAMHEICGTWKASRLQKKSFGSLEQNFSEKGFTYKARESQTSLGKWPEDYAAVYKGKKVVVEQHLALGKGGPDTCLRIQFFEDLEDGKFVVAHVGRHKTNTKT